METTSSTAGITGIPDPQRTGTTRRCYQRLSPFYDLKGGLAERRFDPWRKKLWAGVQGPCLLEVGVGTGRNMPFYPKDISISGIDLTPGMLQRAQKRAGDLGLNSRVDLHLGDVQELNFPDAMFDSAVATFVFCSVADPVLGLRELRRVVKLGGSVLLLEHMRSSKPFLGATMDFLNPLVVRMMGANINRRTVDNVRLAGLEIEQIQEMDQGDIIKLIVARVPSK